MKFVYFLIYAFILPIFGLTACQPDKSPDNLDSSADLKIKSSNISHNQLNNAKTIDITDSIFLDFRDSKNQENYSQVKSKCWNDDLEDFSNFAIIENTEFLPVKDIVPVQVFTPFLNSKPKFFCNFEISILNENEQNVNYPTISLKEIEITNIENFTNFELPLQNVRKTPEEPLYLQKKNIKDKKLTLPIISGQVFTLCENSGKVYSFDKQVLTMSVLTDENLFKSNNLSFCRLVIHQENPEKNWVTETFFIQDQEPKIGYHYKHNYSANTENQWNDQKMGVLILLNEGPAKVYLQISEFLTKVSVMGVYSNFSKKNVNHRSNQIVDINVFWTVDEGTPIKKENKESPDIYKLEVGESMSLSLKTHDGFLCNYGEPLTTMIQKILPVTPVFSSGIENEFDSKLSMENFTLQNFQTFMEIEKNDCKTLFYLSGLLYHLHAFPKITYNSFETMNYQKWKLLFPEKPFNRQYGGEFSQWVPNYQVSRHCPGLEIKNELKNYPTKNNALNSFFDCQLHSH